MFRLLGEAICSASTALIGSCKKAAALKAATTERGAAAEHLARLKAPTGLDLGAITADEIAISMLAEIVAAHPGKDARSARRRRADRRLD
jgi:xanthine/CO dehydrogenase XdhC/CoxF family maturation factor